MSGGSRPGQGEQTRIIKPPRRLSICASFHGVEDRTRGPGASLAVGSCPLPCPGRELQCLRGHQAGRTIGTSPRPAAKDGQDRGGRRASQSEKREAQEREVNAGAELARGGMENRNGSRACYVHRHVCLVLSTGPTSRRGWRRTAHRRRARLSRLAIRNQSSTDDGVRLPPRRFQASFSVAATRSSSPFQ